MLFSGRFQLSELMEGWFTKALSDLIMTSSTTTLDTLASVLKILVSISHDMMDSGLINLFDIQVFSFLTDKKLLNVKKLNNNNQSVWFDNECYNVQSSSYCNLNQSAYQLDLYWYIDLTIVRRKLILSSFSIDEITHRTEIFTYLVQMHQF